MTEEFRFPISLSEALGLYDKGKSDEDKAADVDYASRALEDFLSRTASDSVPQDDVKRGTVNWTLGASDTNTSTVVIFSTQFTATPVVTLGVLNAAGFNLGTELTAVTSAQFTVRIFPTAGSAVGAASGSVHWHAIEE